MDTSSLLALVPAAYAGDASVIATAVISVCAVIARFWARPADGSKWLALYTLINMIAQNGGHAANADDKGTGK